MQLMHRTTKTLIGLALINAVIVVATEHSGDAFYHNGAIHFVAVLFIALALTRIPVLWRPYKEPAGRFVRWMLLSLLVFASSHVLEYVGYVLNGEYSDAMFANVGNVYLISLFAIIVGVEHILRAFYSRPRWFTWLPVSAMVPAVAASLFFMMRPEFVSLEPDEFLPYFYTVIIVAIGIFGFVNLLEVRRLRPQLTSFVKYSIYVLLFVIAAALVNIQYELLEDFFGIEEVQLIYIAHFLFYLGLSMMYFTFGEPVRSLAEQSTQEN